MVPRPNLDVDSIYLPCSTLGQGILTHCEDEATCAIRPCTWVLASTVVTPLGIESLIQCVPLLNPNKGLFNICLHTLHLVLYVPLLWLVMSGKVKAPLGSKSFEVHPTNS